MKSIFTPILAIILLISSCSKDSSTPNPSSQTYPLQGLWIGTWTIDGQPGAGEQYFSFIVKPDGTIVADSRGAGQQNLAIGPWSLAGSTFTCTFTLVWGNVQNIGTAGIYTGVWDKTGKLTGTWRNAPPNNSSGVINLARVN